jgi:hypothetical protein
MNYNEQDNNLSSAVINTFVNHQIVFYKVNEFDINKISEIIQKYDTVWSNIDLYM